MFNQKEHFTVGGNEFSFPEGYHEGKQNKFKDYGITNGKSHIYIRSYDSGTKLDEVIDGMEGYMENKSLKYGISEFNVQDTLVTKLSINNLTTQNYYWFEYGHHIYYIYTYDAGNIDKIVSELINSINH